MTIEEILEAISALEKEINLTKETARKEKIKQLTDRLSMTADSMLHDQKAKLYVDFMESSAYVDSCKQAIEQTGTIATDRMTGATAAIKLNPDSTVQTFSPLQAGSTVDIKGSSYLVAEFTQSHAGSTAKFIPLNATFQIIGERETPYSGKLCHMQNSTNTLTVGNQDRLKQGAVISIDGIKYVPINHIGASPYFARYELEVVR